jgi:hypothetical protein
MYRIGAVRIGQLSAWQTLQNNRYKSANFASDAAVFATMSDTLFGAQQSKVSGIATLVVQAAMNRIIAEQKAQSASTLNQVNNTLSQAKAASTSSTSSVLSTYA